MKFEVVECPGGWLVCRDGAELARFGEQDEALADVAERLRDVAKGDGSYSLAMRYAARG